jgi:hypothetical protein
VSNKRHSNKCCVIPSFKERNREQIKEISTKVKFQYLNVLEFDLVPL